MKRKISALLAFVLLLSASPAFSEAILASDIKNERKIAIEQAISAIPDDADAYEEGGAIITVPALENAAFTKKGSLSFDPYINVEAVHDFGDEYVIHLTSSRYSTEKLIKKAYDIYYVKSASANTVSRLESLTDPAEGFQWHLSDINVYDAPKASSKEEVVVAVIDSGVDYNHPDLKNSLWVNPFDKDKLPGKYGYDPADNDDDPMDLLGHGTSVAGIIAAEMNNNTGVRGVSSAKIMSLKATASKDGYLYTDGIVGAFEYVYKAINMGVNIKVVNCSWGGSEDVNGTIGALVDKVGRAGAVIVFAAGNDGFDHDMTSWDVMPYTFNRDYIVIVGAADRENNKSYFSDFGKSKVDLFAPGENILSTSLRAESDYFEPWAYSETDRDDTTLYLNAIEKSDINILPGNIKISDLYTAEDLGIVSDYSVVRDYKWDGENKYLDLSVTMTPETVKYNSADRKEEAGSFYIDVTDLNLDEYATYYVSVSEGTYLNGNSISWKNVTLKSTASASRFFHVRDRVYFRLVGLVLGDYGTVNRAFDNICISKANVNISSFPTYDTDSGTSMAAPVVSGTAAIIAALVPDFDALELKSALTSSVRKVDSLKDYCITGGVIDLSKLPMYPKSFALVRGQVNLKYGKSVTLKTIIKPEAVLDTSVTWTVSNDKYARVTKNGTVKAKKAGIGHKVKVTATTKNGKKDYCIVKIKG